MTAKKTKWKGDLAAPILEPKEIRPHGYFVDPETVESENKALLDAMDEVVALARLEKLSLLFEHYGIENKSDYFRLSLALAVEHVPGFALKHVTYKLSHGDYGAVEPATKTGRRREWTSERLGALLDAVEAIKREKNIRTDREALQRLSRRPPWKPQANHRGDATQWVETLESCLQHAKTIRKRVQMLDRQLSEMIEKHSLENSENITPV